MTHSTRGFSSSFRPVLLLGSVWLALLAGCAQNPSAIPPVGASVEPVTASDEPDARRRARIRLELAASYFGQGQDTVALDEIKLSLLADPTYADAHALRGLVYSRMNELGLAEASFQRALQLNPRDANVAHNYGVFLCDQRRYPASFEMFSRAMTSPTYGGRARTLLAQGVCQLRAGQLQDAEASLARSYELDPGNPIAAYNLASLLYRRGELPRSQFIIRRVNNSEFGNAETLWLGIKVEQRLGNAEAMAQLAQQLGRRYPESREWASYQRRAFDE